MKRITSLLFLLMGAALPVHAGFPDSPLADLVVGAPDLDTPGSAAANDTSFDYPIGVAVDPVSGKLFVSCYDQHRVLRFANASALATGAAAEAVFGQPGLTSAGSGTTRASLNTPLGICLDSQGRLWVAEVANHRVLMFEDAANSASGVEASLVIGQPDFVSRAAGTGLGQFNHPAAVFVDAGDNLWVCDYLNSRVLKFPAASSLTNGAAATVEIGGNGTSANQLFYPIGVLVDAGDRLWVVEQNNNRVLKFDNAGQLASGAAASVVLGQPGFGSDSQGTSATTMRVPSGLAMDTEGTLWVADQWNSRVLGFRNAAAKQSGDPADQVIGQPDFDTAAPSISAGRMNYPVGLAFDADGRLWVADTRNDRILRFSPDPLPPLPDRTGPVLRVTSKVPRSTKAARLQVAGTAGDPSGVAAVRYRLPAGGFRQATGTVSWRFVAPLRRGRNTIQIVADDSLGNTSTPKILRVSRR